MVTATAPAPPAPAPATTPSVATGAAGNSGSNGSSGTGSGYGIASNVSSGTANNPGAGTATNPGNGSTSNAGSGTAAAVSSTLVSLASTAATSLQPVVVASPAPIVAQRQTATALLPAAPASAGSGLGATAPPALTPPPMLSATQQSASQYQAEVVSICWQLEVLGSQLQALAPFGAGLAPLIVGLESLTRSDPSVTPLLAALQQASNPAPTVGALVARVALLDRLLARLTRIDPVAAKRLAHALPKLHMLMTDLLLATSGGALRPSQSLSAPGATAAVLQPVLALMAANPALGAAPGAQARVLSDAAQNPQQWLGPVAPRAIHSRSQRAGAPHRSAASSSAREIAPPAAPPLGGGVTGSATGGLGFAAPAAVALLAALIIWLLSTLSSERVAAYLVPRRAMLLAALPERPG